MPEWVQRGIECLIVNRAPSLDGLKFSWFGGEPLVAKDVVLRLSRHAHSLSGKYGFQFRGGLTTNGYFLKTELADELISLNQDFFQISLDGWGSGHDATRRMANGSGTFDRIWSNVLDLRRLRRPFEVALRVHVTPLNLASLEHLCAEISLAFGTDDRFCVDFQDIRDLGGPGGVTVVPQSALDFAARVRHLSDILSPAGMASRMRVTAGGKADGEDLHICYAAKPNSLLIRANGRLGKCTVLLDSPVNDVGAINEDGTLTIDQPRLRRWFRGLQSLDASALSCPAQFLS
jgi:uncharacterized protein